MRRSRGRYKREETARAALSGKVGRGVKGDAPGRKRASAGSGAVGASAVFLADRFERAHALGHQYAGFVAHLGLAE